MNLHASFVYDLSMGKRGLLFILLTGMSAFSADLTTPAGSFHVENSWVMDNYATQEVLRGFISFTAASNLSCRNIRIIQAARVQVTGGGDYTWREGQEVRNQIRSDAGYFIDFDATKCPTRKNCSPYFRDSWPNSDESAEGYPTTSIVDYPFGWDQFEQIHLETCAVCVDDERPIQCVTWGAKWPEVGAREIFVPSVGNASPSFLQALLRFKTF